MNLETLSQHIPEKIYQRGKEYYEEGLVTNVTYEESGKWTAYVEGSDIYEVEVDLEGDNIVSWDCDCPYDYGDICKHVVALLLHIKNKKNAFTINTQPVEKKREKSENLAELFKNTDKKALVSFLSSYSNKHPDFLQELKQALLTKKKGESSVNYKKEIEKCFAVGKKDLSYNRYGYTNEEEVIAGKLSDFTEKARFFIKNGLLEDALKIALSIMEEVADCYEEYEDYNGDLGVACQEASVVMEEVIESGVSSELMGFLIEKLGQLIKNQNFSNYELADIEGLLLSATLKSSGIDESIKLLDETLKAEPDSFRTYSLVLTKLELLKKAGRQEEINKEIDKYIYLPQIRKIKLNNLLDENEYEKTIGLIDEGIAEAEMKNHHGTIIDWMDCKLSVYKKSGNKEMIIATARNLFFKGNDAMKYYHVLKKMIPTSQWANYLDELLSQKQESYYNHVRAQIYIEEKYWDKLMEWAQQHTSLSNRYDSAEEYEKYLRIHFPDQLLEMYRLRIIHYAQCNIGRDHYQFIAKILQKIKNYPNGEKVVADLVHNFRNIYANRRAMMEELKGI